MSTADVVRAWRDPEYRSTLGAAERAALPDYPASSLELGDDEREAGGSPTTMTGGPSNTGVGTGGGCDCCAAQDPRKLPDS